MGLTFGGGGAELEGKTVNMFFEHFCVAWIGTISIHYFYNSSDWNLNK